LKGSLGTSVARPSIAAAQKSSARTRREHEKSKDA
jgi:hypothetical protein